MSSHAITPPAQPSLLRAFSTQMRVIGALMMRELHTRYGRENVGYLWLIGEPLMLASVIASLHTSGGHTAYGSDIKPLPFSVVGYTIFILFRGIVNRSEGALEANAPLLYHRMVTLLDIMIARALLEAAGTFLAYSVLISLLVAAGLAAFPVRPLYFFAAVGLLFWYSMGHSLIIVSISHDNRTVGRFVHPYSYFMIPLSAAFFQMEWIPQPFRYYLGFNPMTHIFELVRYGQFRSANLKYFDCEYVVGCCLILTWIGLVATKLVRERVHLA